MMFFNLNKNHSSCCKIAKDNKLSAARYMLFLHLGSSGMDEMDVMRFNMTGCFKLNCLTITPFQEQLEATKQHLYIYIEREREMKKKLMHI